jgi:predicted DNA-binding ribbon-helix-helix protein
MFSAVQKCWYFMSLTIPRSIFIAGRKTSIRLENAFWVGLQEIADKRLMTLQGLIVTIDAQHQHQNRSSALRLFVLEYYRSQVADASEASSSIRLPPHRRSLRVLELSASPAIGRSLARSEALRPDPSEVLPSVPFKARS